MLRVYHFLIFARFAHNTGFKHIRHHKFPTEEKSSDLRLSDTNGDNIRILVRA